VALRIFGIAILCALSIAVLLKAIIPAACLVLGLGIDVPDALARSRNALFFYSHPWASLLVGVLSLALLGWGVLRLIRG
jgi:hypothetical protein